MRNVGYFAYFRCDEKNKPEGIRTDMSFELHEIDQMADTLILADKHKLNYDFGIQSFEFQQDAIIEEIDIISKNHLN